MFVKNKKVSVNVVYFFLTLTYNASHGEEHMARKIVITSGKGGVGKTTICANLGVALSKLNKRVVLVDVDIGLNNLDVVMGVENKIVYDIVDVIEDKCRVKQALIQDINHPTLYVLPSAHSYNCSHVTAENVKSVVDKLNDLFDFVLIDQFF